MLSQNRSKPESSIRVEQLIALNDEIAALARAGVPLDRGLIEMGAELPGKLGRLADAMGRRIASGEELAKVLAGETSELAAVHRAVIEAGLRSGRLPVALEGMSLTMRRAAEMRRLIGLSLIYPLIVVGLAYGLFVFLSIHWAPVIESVQMELLNSSHVLVRSMSEWGRSAHVWAPVFPAIVLCLVVFWWWRSGRTAVIQRRGQGVLSRAIGSIGFPTVGGMIRSGRVATFAQVLALLVDHDVKWDEAIELAGGSCGDRRIGQWCRDGARRLRRGESLAGAVGSACPLPPLLAWLIVSSERQPRLVAALYHAAETHRRRARRLAHALSFFIPIALSVGIGGTVTFAQVLIVMIPWFQMLERLSWPA